ncbi:glycosyltransferase family 2 protein [Streptomyces sp. NPDC021212]|uniref:glycosyltransferase family 2 protein n=1 Tax=Streptomyces sp. NPDC021212 TaxID=3365118 RepID=UPI0037B478C5
MIPPTCPPAKKPRARAGCPPASRKNPLRSGSAHEVIVLSEVTPEKKPILISVVLPCYNEEAVLLRTHARLSSLTRQNGGVRYELMYVDDGSTDRSWEIIQDLADRDTAVRAVRFSRNFGHQAACMAGLREAAGDAVVVIDADLQDPPELIPQMVELWREGWPVASARRTGRSGESVFKKATAFTWYRLLTAVSEYPVAVDVGDFRLLDRKVVDTLTGLGDSGLYLRGAVSWAGFPEASVAYQRDARAAGESKYTLGKMLALSRRGLINGSAAPLRAVSVLGVASLAGALGLGVLRRDARNALPVGLFALQALSLGTVGEYVYDVLGQVRRRPPYVVRDRVGEAAGAALAEAARPLPDVAQTAPAAVMEAVR